MITPEQLTIVGLTIAAAIGIYQAGRKRIWVWGYQLDDERTEKEFWRGLYLRLAGVTEDLIEKRETPKPPAKARPRATPARRRAHLQERVDTATRRDG